jgi:hypothetical protein
MKKDIEVFLGGTTNESDWRDKLIPKLKIESFNPVVKDWNEEAQNREIEKRKSCDYVLYVITPKMLGVYSIAEVVDDSNKRPKKTLFVYLTKDDDKEFNTHQIKSMKMVKKMVEENGAKSFDTLDEIATFLNNASIR